MPFFVEYNINGIFGGFGVLSQQKQTFNNGTTLWNTVTFYCLFGYIINILRY